MQWTMFSFSSKPIYISIYYFCTGIWRRLGTEHYFFGLHHFSWLFSFHLFIGKHIYRGWRNLQNILKFHMQYPSFQILLHSLLTCTFIFSEIPNTFYIELRLLTGDIKLSAGQQMTMALLQVPSEMWKVTCDRCHVTGDMWHQQIA